MPNRHLNRQLEGVGYPAFDRAMLAIGGGGHTVREGGLMLGEEGYGVLTGENLAQGRSLSLGDGHGLFNIGYLRRPSPNLDVFPMIGFGGGGVRMALGRRPFASAACRSWEPRHFWSAAVIA